MLSPRDPGNPGIPPTWTPNYDTYERDLHEYLEEKTRQRRRRLRFAVVISVVAAAICYSGAWLTRHLG